QPLNADCADTIYEILKKYPKEITFVILGPHTNFAYLLQKYPDSKDLIKNIIMMGGAPKGIKTNPNHSSFNIRTDIPAFQKTIDTGLEIIMCPSSIGRDEGYFTEQQVNEIKNTNQVGAFLAKTFETYWEPKYEDKRIATNDISAVYYLTHPRLYKTKRAFIKVEENGRTVPTWSRKGNFKIVVKLNRKRFQKLVFKKLKEMNGIVLELYKTDSKPAKKSVTKKTNSTSKTSTKTKSNSKNTTAKKTAK
ncbi:MAG: nucleoside hydrolase, partial [Candidatus Caccovivens sp.]